MGGSVGVISEKHGESSFEVKIKESPAAALVGGTFQIVGANLQPLESSTKKSKFKIGDKVKIKSPHHYEGSIGVISELPKSKDGSLHLVKILESEKLAPFGDTSTIVGKSLHIQGQLLELIDRPTEKEKSKFNVGDKVKIKGGHPFDGTIGVINGEKKSSVGYLYLVKVLETDKLDAFGKPLVGKTIHMQGQLLELIEPSTKEKTFNIGDKVKIKYGHALAGAICVVKENIYESGVGVEVIDSKDANYTYHSLVGNNYNINTKYLELIESATKKPKFNIGDKVKIKSPHPYANAMGVIKIKETEIPTHQNIVEIIDSDETDYVGHAWVGNSYYVQDIDLELIESAEKPSKKPKFNVGDKVKIKHAGDVLENSEGVIEKVGVDGYASLVKIINSDILYARGDSIVGYSFYITDDKLELIKPKLKFSIGDKVLVNDSYTGLITGAIGIIHENEFGGYKIEIIKSHKKDSDGKSIVGETFNVKEDFLSLVEKKLKLNIGDKVKIINSFSGFLTGSVGIIYDKEGTLGVYEVKITESDKKTVNGKPVLGEIFNLQEEFLEHVIEPTGTSEDKTLCVGDKVKINTIDSNYPLNGLTGVITNKSPYWSDAFLVKIDEINEVAKSNESVYKDVLGHEYSVHESALSLVRKIKEPQSPKFKEGDVVEIGGQYYTGSIGNIVGSAFINPVGSIAYNVLIIDGKNNATTGVKYVFEQNHINFAYRVGDKVKISGDFGLKGATGTITEITQNGSHDIKVKIETVPMINLKHLIGTSYCFNKNELTHMGNEKDKTPTQSDPQKPEHGEGGNLNGTWEGGVWKYGTWKDGRWKNGTWESGLWENGVWEGGLWEDGIWEGGVWKGGQWESGTWKHGIWEYGLWGGGAWIDGTWEDGNWKGGIWKDGVWEKGHWYDGIWERGRWLGGVWEKGTWNDGIWVDGTWKDGQWEKGWIYDPHKKGKFRQNWEWAGEYVLSTTNPKDYWETVEQQENKGFEKGKFIKMLGQYDGSYGIISEVHKNKKELVVNILPNADMVRAKYEHVIPVTPFSNKEWKNGIWEGGLWLDGVWKGGTWKDGTWLKGTWKDGLWENGTWAQGTWENGIWYNGTWWNGLWIIGQWNSGVWRSGTWNTGTWWGGKWETGLWRIGTWMDGHWYDGTWTNGLWVDGIW